MVVGLAPTSCDELLEQPEQSTRGGHRAKQLEQIAVLALQQLRHRRVERIAVPIADAVRKPKHVPTHGELVQVAQALGIELGG